VPLSQETLGDGMGALTAKGNVDGAIAAIDSRLMHLGQGSTPSPKSVAAPSALPSGSAAPSQSSLDSDYAIQASTIKGGVNPKGDFAKNQKRAGGSTAPVGMPESLQGVKSGTQSAETLLNEGFETQKTANKNASERVKDEIGVSRTADGRTIFNEQLANTASNSM
jgi:hypothetical protein